MKSTSGTGYFDNERPEVARLVDESRKTVLDVGCGTGRMGALLLAAVSNRRVYGIELDEQAAEQARLVLTDVQCGDVRTMELPYDEGLFDCMIFADVLEHVDHPEEVLRRLKPYLSPNGIIVCSIPNMRHYTVILRLLLHGWEYADFGHFDRTHLRFFSLRSMKELVTSAGFEIVEIVPKIVASRKLRFLNVLFLGRLRDFLAFQYLIKARRRSSATP